MKSMMSPNTKESCKDCETLRFLNVKKTMSKGGPLEGWDDELAGPYRFEVVDPWPAHGCSTVYDKRQPEEREHLKLKLFHAIFCDAALLDLAMQSQT